MPQVPWYIKVADLQETTLGLEEEYARLTGLALRTHSLLLLLLRPCLSRTLRACVSSSLPLSLSLTPRSNAPCSLYVCMHAGRYSGLTGFVQMSARYFLICYQFVPISLYVSMMMYQTIYKQFIVAELEMYDRHLDEPCQVPSPYPDPNPHPNPRDV